VILPDELPLSTLLEQPQTAMILMSMYEGLARTCDRMKDIQSQRDKFERYRHLYVKHVGVDFLKRDDLRQRVGERIQQELALAALNKSDF
jgi:hypothetical protein